MTELTFRAAVDSKDLDAARLVFEADPLHAGEDDPRLLRRFGHMALRGGAPQAAHAAYGLARRFAPASERDYSDEILALLRDPEITEDAILDEVAAEALKVHPQSIGVARMAVQVAIGRKKPPQDLATALERLGTLEPLDARQQELLNRARRQAEAAGTGPDAGPPPALSIPPGLFAETPSAPVLPPRPAPPAVQNTATHDTAAQDTATDASDFLRLPRLVAEGRFDDAMALVEALRARFPDEPLADRLAAQVALRQGDRATARLALESYVARVPHDVWGVSLLASTLSHGGAHEEALGLLDNARQRGVEHELVDFTAAEIFARIEQWELAAESYAAVPVASTHHVRAALGQLVALQRAGDLTAARDLAAELTQRYPDHVEIRQRRMALDAARGA